MGATKTNISIIAVDLFCGAGGVSEGFRQATDQHGRQVAYIAAAVNHSPVAIQSHQANHPDTFHLEEDIWLANVEAIAEAVRKAKHLYPGARVVIWMSAECTHYSRAGGLFQSTLRPWRPVSEVLDLHDHGASIFERPEPLVEATLQRILAGLHKFVGQPAFMSKYFTGHPASKNYSLHQPAHTVTTRDHNSIVFIQKYFKTGICTSIGQPSPTVTTRDRFGLVTAQYDRAPFIMATNFSNIGSSVSEPMRTITADRHWHYLLNPQFKNAGNNIAAPAPTLIARQDKRPIQLVSVAPTGPDHSIDQPGDTDTTLLIKSFMRRHHIRDIKMRMLKIIELKLITGFPAGYILKGTQGQQKEMIGNAVPVYMARAFAETLHHAA